MYHLHLFRDADQMAANYLFLTGSQLDTIQAAKRDILSLSERLQRLETLIISNDGTTDPERLERWYFFTVSKYIKCAIRSGRGCIRAVISERLQPVRTPPNGLYY